jgi:hypothetical protein
MATLVLTEAELIDRVCLMEGGQSTVYYRGHLSADAYVNPDVAKLRDAAQRLSTMLMMQPTGERYLGMGLVTLSQKRAGDAFEYIATRVTMT